MYIHERDNWTDFRWSEQRLALLQEEVCRKQGLLYGRLSSLGFDSKLVAMAENVTKEVVHSSEIEGVRLNIDQVRSSVARKLGVEQMKYTAPSHYVDSVVAVVVEAMEHYDQELTKEKLCNWQAAFFPNERSEGLSIEVGCYRTHEEHIVSGSFGRERVHYIAPSPERVESEMDKFIGWFNANVPLSFCLRSAIAHLWFVSIHPFEDGNGRLSRLLSDILLARGDASGLRFYNISQQINKDKKHYYEILERTQRGNGDITEWLEWYLLKLRDALDDALCSVKTVLNKSIFWQTFSMVAFSERQMKVLNLFLDGYEAKLTTKSWSAIADCSKDTAQRDIQDLVQKGILRFDVPGAKRPSYSIVYEQADNVTDFTDMHVVYKGDVPFLQGRYKGMVPVYERLLPLDAERFEKDELPIESLLHKYCSYLQAYNH